MVPSVRDQEPSPGVEYDVMGGRQLTVPEGATLKFTGGGIFAQGRLLVKTEQGSQSFLTGSVVSVT